ncbi:MAG: Stp1/IreP family PP2C-type Ser/Thr phosphatase [Thermoleophilia bacterium]|nr:Stp1/IreP family PP2C-type Ser/Thr phosphatase [Thermoleophilia bacterium]MDQ3859564.1 Stp1/IreP family PP2C-type Ser/Thr phosphatase [Actinomycetota bacterium]
MRVREHAGITDAGRRRRRNEDSFVVDPPFFVVADGMGGAQAGEVASRLAAAAFREYHDADDLDGERRLEAIIQEANRRIFERAQADTAAEGMGTTVTAALVDGGSVAIGHVGDSRAYRVRSSQIEQLTQDHSLVADLIRSGRLAPEEADAHPQRSVITRALGTDADVDVDTFTVDAEAGDLFLLCSDGLTSMVTDDEILDVARGSENLDRLAKALVKAANRRGGEDNVTVVLFALDEGEPGLQETVPMTVDGHGNASDLEDTLSGLEVPPHVRPTPPSEEVAEAREGETAIGWTPLPERRGDGSPARRGRTRPRRRLAGVSIVLAFAAVLLLAAFWGLANAHFVGAEEDGRIAVYQGLPYDVGGGVSLYRARYVSTVRAAQLSQDERQRLFDHDLMSYAAARDRLARFETEAVP